MAEINARYPDIRDAGGNVVALSSDTAEKAAEVASKGGLAFPVLADTPMHVAKAYGVRQSGKHAALPAAFVLDAEHKIVLEYVGVEANDRTPLEDLIEALRK